METIKEAKEHLRENFKNGVNCPCCGQLVKLYTRKLNSGMAMALIHIYKQGDWVDVKDYLRKNSLKNNHDWTLLRYWGLIEEFKGKVDPNKKNNGVWRITQKGVSFIENKIKLKSHIIIYNNKLTGYSDTYTHIKKALGSKFNYNELMKNI